MKILTLSKAAFVIFSMAAVTSVNVHAIGEDDILGTWRIVDLRKGASKAKGQFYKDTKGGYSFKITEVLKDNYRARKIITSCEKCPGSFNNRPLEGMRMMWGFKAKDHDYMRGVGIDPWTRQMFKSDLHLNQNKSMLKITKNYVNNSKSNYNASKTYYFVREK